MKCEHCGRTDELTEEMVQAIRKDLYRRLINTGRFTGTDRGIVMGYFEQAVVAAAHEEKT